MEGAPTGARLGLADPDDSAATLVLLDRAEREHDARRRRHRLRDGAPGLSRGEAGRQLPERDPRDPVRPAVHLRPDRVRDRRRRSRSTASRSRSCVESDLIDPDALAARIAAAADPVSAHLRSAIGGAALLDGLNAVVASDAFYDAGRFAGITLQSADRGRADRRRPRAAQPPAAPGRVPGPRRGALGEARAPLSRRPRRAGARRRFAAARGHRHEGRALDPGEPPRRPPRGPRSRERRERPIGRARLRRRRSRRERDRRPGSHCYRPGAAAARAHRRNAGGGRADGGRPGRAGREGACDGDRVAVHSGRRRVVDRVLRPRRARFRPGLDRAPGTQGRGGLARRGLGGRAPRRAHRRRRWARGEPSPGPATALSAPLAQRQCRGRPRDHAPACGDDPPRRTRR